MKKIAIFASGSGSNAENIANYFKGNNELEISLILSNKKDAYVLERAKNLKIPSIIFNKQQFSQSDEIVKILKEKEIDLIVLAGFLWLIPSNLIEAFPNKIVNIHPALLPNYGGKGMYGMKVHEAIVANKENKTGITIHFVNEKYDEGKTIFQTTCEVLENDTAEDVAKKIHQLEYKHFPEVIDELLFNTI